MKKMFLLLFLAVSSIVAAQSDVLTKYTFIPGDKVIFAEDLSSTPIGEIPESFKSNGEAQVVSVDNEKWLKVTTGTELSTALKSNSKDMTIEFYIKGKNDSSWISIDLINEQEELYETITVSFESVSWNGSYKGEGVPSNSISKNLYKKNEKALVCIMIQKGRTKVFVNQIQVMNVTDFTPVMPSKMIFKAGVNEEKDFIAFNGVRVAENISSVAQKLNEGKYIAYGIYFDTGSDKIRHDSYATLKQIAEALQTNSSLKLHIVGYADNTGTDKGKVKKLTLMRSESVKKYLVEKFQIDSSRLSVDGKGSENPVADNNTANGRSLNRRVEFTKK